MKKEDIEFLRELQHELNIQSNECNADPVIWGVMETVEQIVPDGFGDEHRAYDMDGSFTFEELIELCEDAVSEDESLKDSWNEIDKQSFGDVMNFCNETLECNFDSVDIEYQSRIAIGTGAFITKKAVVAYIEKYGHNHSKPKPWSMCAYRNFELQRLLKILKSMNIDDIKITEE